MDLPKTFTIYLKTQGFSAITVRNYLCDLRHFLGWMELSLRGQNLPFTPEEPQLLGQYFNQALVEKYRSYLACNQLPVSTINRRLSTLRTFAQFCLSQAWIVENPTKEINNIQHTTNNKGNQGKILEEFKDYLEAQKTSSNTIKNYLADIREFLNFVASAT
jgi:site-specific recombinase XerD